jgi:hypothetical protein
MSFGRWYEEKKNEENGDIEGGSSWFGGADQLLPTFSTEGLQPLTWSGMKEAMESQMPKTILGMGYAQRFKVRLSLPLWCSAQRLFAHSMRHISSHTMRLHSARSSVGFCFSRRSFLPSHFLSVYR